MRLKPLDRGSLPEDLSALMEGAEAMMGFTANDGLLMARKPAMMKALSALTVSIYRDTSLDQGLIRLIAFIASTAAGCRYCKGHTAFGALNHDVSREKLEDAWAYETSNHFSEAERAALRVAHHAAIAPHEVTDDVFEGLKELWSEQEIIDIVAVVSLFGFLNRWNSVLGTDLEDAVTGGVGGLLG